MGLFSRRTSVRPAEAPPSTEPQVDEADPAQASRAEIEATEAGQPTRDSSGPVVHTALQQALTGWAREKNSATLGAVLAELTAGELLLDLTRSTLADPSAGPQQGDIVAIAHQTDNAGKRLLLAFTSADRLARYREVESPVSFAQPAAVVVEQAVREYEGIALDPGSPETQFIAYSDEIRRGLGDDVTASAPVARALAERTIAWPDMLELLRTSPSLFVAEVEQRDAAGEVASTVVATATGEQGELWSVVHTTPAGAWAWAPGSTARAVSFADLARTALAEGHAGVVVEPGDRSVAVTPDELRTLAAR
jgi:hypothetical protein